MYSFIFNFIHIFDKIMREREKTQYLILHFNVQREKKFKMDLPRFQVFSRPDKLKLHMLRHTSHREFMCETCGRQFKRKDKLKEHTKRMHSAEREAWQLSRPQKPPSLKRFTPKVGC